MLSCVRDVPSCVRDMRPVVDTVDPDPDRGVQQTVVPGICGQGGVDERVLSTYQLKTKPNEVRGGEHSRTFACRDVPVVKKGGVTDVVRPVVQPDVPGTHPGDTGDTEKGIPLCGMPRGGERSCSSTSSQKPKPNRVKGGLLARVQMWELKTGGAGDNFQREISTEKDTENDTRVCSSARYRKQR